MGSIGISELLMLLLIPVLYVATLIWGYRDATARGSNGVLVALLIGLLSGPCPSSSGGSSGR
ncbi:MAG: hypothetical protein O3C45_07820 [Bacteroidetes bacterium]|nr:hypothetical protein [Bacteroidota bacterium]MDA0874953.1 hypothetical protein [Bacteroidota bacterium]